MEREAATKPVGEFAPDRIQHGLTVKNPRKDAGHFTSFALQEKTE